MKIRIPDKTFFFATLAIDTHKITKMQQLLLNLEGRGLWGAVAHMWGHFLGLPHICSPYGALIVWVLC